MNYSSTLDAKVSETTLIESGGQMQSSIAPIQLVIMSGQIVSGIDTTAGEPKISSILVMDGGTLLDADITWCSVWVNGQAGALKLSAEGFVFVSSGGTLSNVIMDELYCGVDVKSGATCNDVFISGGHNNVGVENGGFLYNTKIIRAQGGFQEVYGYVFSNILIGSMTYQRIYSGGVASDNHLTSGAISLVSNGGLAIDTTLTGGARQHVYFGVASNTRLGLAMQIVSGGSAYDTLLGSGAIQNVVGGGVAYDTYICSNALQEVVRADAYDTLVDSGGVQTIGEGASAFSTVITGGTQIVLSGGEAYNTKVIDGVVNIQSNSKLVNVTAYGNGSTTINSGCTLSGTYTANGGSLNIANGAITQNLNIVITLSGASDYTMLTVTGAIALDSLNWSVNDGGSTATGIYKITNVSLSSLNLVLSGTQRTITAGSSFDITNSNGTVTYSLASSSATGTVLNIYGAYRALYGVADGNDWRLTTANSKVTGGLFGTTALASATGNVYLDINLNAENNTANIYGLGASSSASGNIEMRLHGNGTYYGLIFAGSYLQNANSTIGGNVNLSVSGITQIQNPAITTGNTNWIMGGCYALAGYTGTVQGNVNMLVDGNANVGQVMGGGYAIGAGATVRVYGDVNMIFRNVTIGGHVAGGGYTTNGGTSIIEGNVNVFIDATESITFYGNIIAGGYNRANGLATVNQVLGTRTVTLTGQGSNINIPYGGINGGDSSPGGTRMVVFDDFTGTFSGGLYYLDKVKFSGNTVLSGLGNTFSCSNFVFDISDRAAIHNNTSMMDNSTALNFKQNTGTIEVILDLGDFNSAKNIALMDYDANLNLDLNVKLFDLDGVQLASFADNDSWAVNDNWKFALSKSNGVISLAYQAIS